jgi:hypothetical protein
VRLPGVTVLLGLTGWTDQRWTGSGGFDLLIPGDVPNAGLQGPALDLLRQAVALKAEGLASALGVGVPEAVRLLARLCRDGKVLYDMASWTYRHRDLFADALDGHDLFPPHPQTQRARLLLETGEVDVKACAVQEKHRQRRFKTPDGVQTRDVVHRDWHVRGRAGDQTAVEAVVSEAGRLLFGTCGCRFFGDHKLGRGPCEHLLALLHASLPLRQEGPVAAANLDTGRQGG